MEISSVVKVSNRSNTTALDCSTDPTIIITMGTKATCKPSPSPCAFPNAPCGQSTHQTAAPYATPPRTHNHVDLIQGTQIVPRSLFPCPSSPEHIPERSPCISADMRQPTTLDVGRKLQGVEKGSRGTARPSSASQGVAAWQGGG